MAIFKRCPCKTPAKCDHPYYIEIMRAGDRERGPVDNYLFLLPPGVPKPTKIEAVKDLEGRVRVWMGQGRPRINLRPDPPDPDKPSITIGDVCDAYQTGHVKRMGDKGAPSIVKRIKAEFATRAILDLVNARVIAGFLDRVEDATSVVNRNRHLSRWSHMLTWARAIGFTDELSGVASPFYHRQFNPGGIKKEREPDARDRRLLDGEEDAIIKACGRIDPSGVMLGRYFAAVDCGFRRGEMLKIKREDVLRNYQKIALCIRIPAANAKSKKARYVTVGSARLAAFLDSRRFAQYPFGQPDGTIVDSFRDQWESVLLDAGIDEGHWSPEKKTTPAGHTYRPWVRTKDGGLHWHDLRHECASRMAETGVDAIYLKEQLGHKDLSTSQRYINASLSARAAAIERSAQAMGL
jgi:integrase